MLFAKRFGDSLETPHWPTKKNKKCKKNNPKCHSRRNSKFAIYKRSVCLSIEYAFDALCTQFLVFPAQNSPNVCISHDIHGA